MNEADLSELLSTLSSLPEELQRVRAVAPALAPQLDGVDALLERSLVQTRAALVQEGTSPELAYDLMSDLHKSSRLADNPFGDRAHFIIGNRRSGTTLLAYLVNASETICSLPENMLCGELAKCDSLLRLGSMVLPHLGLPQSGLYPRLGRMIDELHCEYAQRFGRQRWIAKELFSSSRLDVIDAMFDFRGKFLFLHRHGLDVALSCFQRFVRRDGLPGNPRSGLYLMQYLDEWVATNEAALDFAERAGDRCLQLGYDELSHTPEVVGARVFEFLGEPWSEQVLPRMAQQRIRPFMGDNLTAQRGLAIDAGARVPSWHACPPELLRSLGRRANPMLERLGYAPL